MSVCKDNEWVDQSNNRMEYALSVYLQELDERIKRLECMCLKNWKKGYREGYEDGIQKGFEDGVEAEINAGC